MQGYWLGICCFSVVIYILTRTNTILTASALGFSRFCSVLLISQLASSLHIMHGNILVCRNNARCIHPSDLIPWVHEITHVALCLVFQCIFQLAILPCLFILVLSLFSYLPEDNKTWNYHFKVLCVSHKNRCTIIFLISPSLFLLPVCFPTPSSPNCRGKKISEHKVLSKSVDIMISNYYPIFCFIGICQHSQFHVITKPMHLIPHFHL